MILYLWLVTNTKPNSLSKVSIQYWKVGIYKDKTW
jgi:hypothetical protein